MKPRKLHSVHAFECRQFLEKRFKEEKFYEVMYLFCHQKEDTQNIVQLWKIITASLNVPFL